MMSWTRRVPLLMLALGAFALLAARAAAADPPIALGVNLADAPGSLSTMQSFASLSGANPSLVMWYQQWSEPLFYSGQLPNTQAMGAIPLITWDPILNGVAIPLANIAAGDYDSYIAQSADAARAWAGPIFIRLAHEMNIGAEGFGPGQDGNTAPDFIAAWRRVVTIFRQQGATNVEWVWSPNVYCGGACPFTSLYPGDAWVDWVALDGYNYSAVDDVPWMTFDQIFQGSYDALTTLTHKPMMIAEIASTEAGGDKAQWITQTFSDIAQNYPQIHAVVWFDRVGETDWTVNSSPGSLAAWQSVVGLPTYQGTASTLLQESPLASDVDSTATASPAPDSSATSTTSPTTTGPSVSGAAAGAPSSSSPIATTPVNPTAGTPVTTAAPKTPSAAPVTKRDIRTAVAAAVHGLLRRPGGLRRLARSLGLHGDVIPFSAPTAGTVTVEVYLGGRRTHRARARQILVASSQRVLRGTGRARLKIRPTNQGRRELQRGRDMRIIVRFDFTPRGDRRLTASATARSG